MDRDLDYFTKDEVYDLKTDYEDKYRVREKKMNFFYNELWQIFKESDKGGGLFSKGNIDRYKVFISYSTKNNSFVNKLQASLISYNVIVWRDVSKIQGGDLLEDKIHEGIQDHDKAILVLSEHFWESKWTIAELKAIDKKRKGKENIIIPISLDDTYKNNSSSIAKEIFDRIHVIDFQSWQNESFFKEKLNKLLKSIEIKKA